MEPHFRSEAWRIFRRELFNMKERGYLTPEAVAEVAKAHHRYHQDLLEEDRQREEARHPQAIEPQPEQHRDAAAPTPALQQKMPLVQQKPKKVLTNDQIRERNISWLLNIGVIFLLVGGLFVATSNWETMTAGMKSAAIALVSVLFYGFAYLSSRILKIEKTAFAFIVLGSLFLPIFVLSLGWFGLLGDYLSVTGEGKFLLGFLGSIVPSAAYVYFAKKLNSRLFAWFSLIGLTVAAGFLLASFKLPIDYFYLGIMGFNGAFIFLFNKLRKKSSIALFLKEFPIFIQASLVISTLLMLFFFDSNLVYGFNLLITAAIYLAMMFVSGRKEYHFVFSAMVVYGAYQMIEHSFLDDAGAIVYAAVAFGFAFVPKGLKGNLLLDKVFRYTSAVVSILAFFYISLEGMLLRAGEPSIVLLLAYIIIAGNFLYLSNTEKQPAFRYLSAAFLGAALYEGASLFGKYIFPLSTQTEIYFAGAALFLSFGLKAVRKETAPIMIPARDIGLGAMMFSSLIAFDLGEWLGLGVMLLLFCAPLFIFRRVDPRPLARNLSIWAIPLCAGLASLAFGQKAVLESEIFRGNYGYPAAFAAGAALLLVVSVVFKKKGDRELAASFFYTAQLMYTPGLISTAFWDIDPLIVRPALFIGGIGMYFLLYRMHRLQMTAVLISTVTLGFYFSIVASAYSQVQFSGFAKSLILPLAAITLLMLAFLIRKKDLLLYSGYGWSGHAVLPVSLMVAWFVFPEWSIYSLIASIAIYGISCFLTGADWKKILFLYSTYTTLFLSVSKGFTLAIRDYSGSYEFPVTSLGILFVWLLLKTGLKQWTQYFLAAFSIFGIASIAFSYPFTFLPYSVTLVYGAGTLAFLHKVKWDLTGILPILFLYFASMGYLSGSGLGSGWIFAITAAFGLLHAGVGYFVYQSLLYRGSQIQYSTFDWYTFGAFLYYLSLYPFSGESIWMAAVPGLVISFTLLMQRKRVGTTVGLFIPFLSGAYLLEPYYGVISTLSIPALFEREAYVLPLVALVIFLRKSMKGRYAQSTGKLQWAVLIFTAIVLVQDGLESNTVYDAIILGTLSLISLLVGMFFRVKSYFFIGVGVLLLNLFLQTRPLWGNLPWWGYLLAAGSLLIGIASYNEWRKQNPDKGGRFAGTRLKEKIVSSMKEWD
ncbi:hypothetical protein DRW41_16750 [Neobacillus piezotolerans]|uniref:DUF2157 domain-containing protein n=1 Tax=Neobacillus piezotolerans TaxID=2259171 RepID=A0A3D8GMU4_9BACI|nr:hypothetical protein [Neobacillus piezotolerans]RDU35783.1 hypothetical protein DRW41_16750 [Neobacillus piezotolerans]